MKFLKINNNANMDLGDSEELFHSLGQYAQKQFGFKRPPALNLISDQDNSGKPLGKTAYYDPEGMTVSIYVDSRHLKDILRSLAHELVHHTQNENGELGMGGYHGEGYAQKNKNLRNMERDAYERGNMCFRDWEDQLKQEKPTIYNERRNYKMSIKDWKNKELNENLNRKWGFSMDLTVLKEEKEITHMCALHVTHKGSGKEGHPIAHTLNENGDISHYTVEFKEVIVENIAVENLNIVEEEMHSHKRDDEKDHDEEKPIVQEEELEEEKELQEEAKPDFADIDKDGDKEEPVSKAAEEKEEKEEKDLSKVPPQLRDHMKSKMKESKLMKTIKRLIREELKNAGKK